MRIVELEWARRLARLARGLKNAGPYVLLELILPGGTLFAILLYVYRTGAFAALQPMPVVCHEPPRYTAACRAQPPRAAWAAASRAIGTRNGEQLT